MMSAKNYQIWLRRFKDKSKNVHRPHSLDHAVNPSLVHTGVNSELKPKSHTLP